MSDAPWSTNTVRLLLTGEARYTALDATGREYEVLATGLTADDMRQAAYAGGPLDMVLDAVQLERAVKELHDPGVRAAMFLRSRRHPHQLTDNQIQDILWSEMGEDRPAWQLIKRGIELIVRGERGRQVVVVEDEADRRRPVCWRCQKRTVRAAGSDCGAKCSALVDKLARPQRDSLENWTLERLTETQNRGSVPGSKYAANMESPVGLTIHGAA